LKIEDLRLKIGLAAGVTFVLVALLLLIIAVVLYHYYRPTIEIEWNWW